MKDQGKTTTTRTTAPSLFGEPDRITASYERMRAQIAQRIMDGLTTAEKVAETGRALDMSVTEFCRFQEIKTLAVADETLTLAEGMTVYGSLGETPAHFNAQPVHVKAVLTSLFKQLLAAELRRASSHAGALPK